MCQYKQNSQSDWDLIGSAFGSNLIGIQKLKEGKNK